MPRFVRTRLSAMMFLFYFGFGSWLVTTGTYLMSAPIKGGQNLDPNQVGWVYSTLALGGMFTPVVVGLLADRLFRAERVLAVSSLACAALMAAAGWWCDRRFPVMDGAYRSAAADERAGGRPPLEQLEVLDGLAGVASAAGAAPLREEIRAALDRVNDVPAVRAAAADTFGVLFAVMLAYCLAGQIGQTLITVISLRNLPDVARSFPGVRAIGTVGWVVAGNLIGLFLAPVSAQPFYLGAAAAGVLGVYAFTLPATPPKGVGKSLPEAFGVPALRLLRDRSFATFLAVGFATSVMNQFYVMYAHRYLTDLGVPRPEQVMTVAQVVEVGCMFAIPFLRPRQWMKWLMLLGLGGWVVRAAVLAAGWVPGVLAVGVPMHGWSYAFYLIVAAGYIDRKAPSHLRASVQGMVGFASSGAGPWVGNLLAAAVLENHKAGTVIDWRPVWLVPLAGCVAATAVFAVLFRVPKD